jgi:Ca2+-binding RTX toxin-like protein
MPANLTTLTAAISVDPGLRAATPVAEINLGLTAAVNLNTVLMQTIITTHVNDDGLITEADMQVISSAVFNNPTNWQKFIIGHGNDNGTVETGFHHVQNDGGSLIFQGRNFIDTVADAIYHFGFDIRNGRYFNEDGNDNELTADVAGWLNYFLNGVNVVHGSGLNDELGTGTYSNYFAKARNETFLAGAGNDKIWSGDGDDKVMGGLGNDTSGAGIGNDSLYGEIGNDTLWGEDGRDTLFGGDGVDTLGGGNQSDLLYGGTGNDTLRGENADDWLFGDVGNDNLSGGEGIDRLRGGAGADKLTLYENIKAVDTLFFAAGDSGKTWATIDSVEGFQSGSDKIDLRAMGPMTFAELDYVAGGNRSCYYDGHFLRVDYTGDGATDMMVEFKYMSTLQANDFIFA